MIGAGGFGRAPNTGVGKNEQNGFVFDWESVPRQKGCRYFVFRDGLISYDCGFRSKKEASDWIEHFGHQVDWRSGFVFRFRGDRMDTLIVDRKSNLIKITR
jgi:hypothetical protein